jgi:hypothetical protein
VKRPVRSSLIATLVLGPLARVLGTASAIGECVQLLALFFALQFVLLLLVTLFWNRQWRLTPLPGWAGAGRPASGRGKSSGLVK